MNGARTQRFRRACQSWVGVGILNFVVFVAIASYLGGCPEWQNRGRTVLRIRSTHGSGAESVYGGKRICFQLQQTACLQPLGHAATGNGCRVCGKSKAGRRKLTSATFPIFRFNRLVPWNPSMWLVGSALVADPYCPGLGTILECASERAKSQIPVKVVP
jgi:hypothetical protein